MDIKYVLVWIYSDRSGARRAFGPYPSEAEADRRKVAIADFFEANESDFIALPIASL